MTEERSGAGEAGEREAADAWRRFNERDLRYAFASTTDALTHDLKNLVGAALMSLRACASRRPAGPPDEGAEFFDDALRTLEQGAKTLDHMRRSLDGPAGGPALVAEAARGAAALLGPSLPATLSLRVEVPLAQTAPVDGAALTHVFFHLFARAAAAIARSGRPGNVVVASAPAPEGWPEGSTAFVVRDDGAPLRGEALPFDPFDPFDPAAPPGLERVRIGLAMVKYLVESGGGEVQLERQGDETVVRCTLPRGAEAPLRLTRA
jgi:signal transduction histidine kinase